MLVDRILVAADAADEGDPIELFASGVFAGGLEALRARFAAS